MRYDPIDPALYIENRKRLATVMEPGALAVVHSSDIMPDSGDGVLPFQQNSDLLYLSGIDQEETVLVLFPGAPDPDDREILFVKETSELIAIWEGAKFTKEQAAAHSGIQTVQWLDAFDSTFRRLMKQAEAVYLNHNEHLRALNEVETRNDRFRARCQATYPGRRYLRLAPLLSRLRAFKSEIELQQLQRAIEITEKGFRRVLPFIKPGVAEYEIEAEFIHEFLRHRSRGFAYQPIIASGANACVLHYVDNDQVCQDGDILLMDVAAEYANYNADLTRSIPVNGRFTPRQREVYNAVRGILRTATTTLLCPGTAVKEYQEQVARLVETELIKLGLLTEQQVKDDDVPEKKEEEKAYRKYFMHGTSHLLGLDVHDVGPADLVIEEDMVFTIEPGIYIREENLGIRLENDILVRKDGNIDLMASIPIDPDEIEELMNP